MLTEIILVDDFSDKVHLKQKLTDYISKLPRTRLIRNSRRYGLIRSRVIGADKAIGEVLVFLDSHCELNKGWVEPLLAPILQSPETVVAPILGKVGKSHILKKKLKIS